MSQESLSPIARGRLCKTTEIFVRIENVFFLFNIHSNTSCFWLYHLYIYIYIYIYIYVYVKMTYCKSKLC